MLSNDLIVRFVDGAVTDLGRLEPYGSTLAMSAFAAKSDLQARAQLRRFVRKRQCAYTL